MKTVQRCFPLAFCIAGALASHCAGQNLPKFGVGVKASTLGIGVEAATAVSRQSNLRVGFNAFDYSHSLDKDGIRYDGKLTLRSFQVLYDQYIKGGFHISPGMLVYNDNHATANASTPGGGSFSLGGTNYVSDRSNPVTGAGTLSLGKAAPMLLMGFGNLLPRSARHMAVNFEFGVVFQGSPNVKLNLNGSACDSSGKFCQSIATYPDFAGQVQAEQKKLNDSLRPFKYYPIVSLGFGYKF